MDAVLNFDATTWMGIGSVIGGTIGAIVVYMIADGKGFREGTLCMMEHREKMALARKSDEAEATEDIPVPEEMDETHIEEEDKDKELAPVSNSV